MLLPRLLPVLGLCAFASSPCWAALGGDADSALRDHAALGATDVVTVNPGYDLHEVRTADGVVVRQYLDHASGKVFALSWQGPRSPAVGDLLGGFAPRYFAAARLHRTGHHVLTISNPDFVLSIFRLPRGWAGQAYVPTALPAGVDRREIR